MHRIFLQLGPITITSYGLMAAIGALTGFLCLKYVAKKNNFTEDQAYDILLYAMIAGIIGARILYVVRFWDKFKDNLIEIIKVYHGGLVFYGGLFASITAIYLYARKNKLDFIRILDLCAPSLPLTHTFGRIGCFLNGCCFGRESTMPWSVQFPPGSDPFLFYGASIPIHPTQLYEAIGNFIIFIVIFFSFPKLKRGQPASAYIVLYGVLRFIVEIFRGDHKTLFLSTFSTSQIISITLIPIGIMLFVFFSTRDDSKENG